MSEARADISARAVIPVRFPDHTLLVRVSFFGAVFTDARIGSVRIIAGNVAPGPFDENGEDIVMMDDFVYGEPQAAAISGPYRRRR